MARPASEPERERRFDLPDLSRFGAVLFDLDGVLTPTAEVHMRAWATLFEEYLTGHDAVAPYSRQDYFDHIDGKPRYDGVAGLLRSRGIELPWGDPGDAPGTNTVCALGNRKDEVFGEILDEEGVAPYAGSVALLDLLEASGTPVAVVSSSRNAARVLAAARLTERFPVVVDGVTAAAEGLAGKPAPDTYLRAAELLGVRAARAVVVEDAVSGTEAGRRGAFGLVVGIDRGAGVAALLASGADVVVSDLGELASSVAPSPLDRRLYPVDEWRFVERTPPTAERRGQLETVFALGNGYLGLRGNPDEGGAAHEHGTFINGFHETWPIRYPEAAYGFAEVGQTILNLADAKTVELEVDGEQVNLDTSEVGEYERVLDMAAGVLERRVVFRLQAGPRVEVRSRRMVSFEDKHLAVLTYSVTPLDADCVITLRSLLVDRQAPDVADDEDEPRPFDPRRAEDMTGALKPRQHGADGLSAHLAHATEHSQLGVAVMAEHLIETVAATGTSAVATPRRTETAFTVAAGRGEVVTLHKLVAYHDGAAGDVEALLAACSSTLATARDRGVGELFSRQRRWLDAFWDDADVRVPGQAAIQQAVRWNLFQLLQASARADGRGIGAKGVSGSGYSGHYFWDTEIYVLPYLMHSRPEMARAALEFRHSLLPAARLRARTMNEAGALFPWRTINGEEASAYYPAGTAQYHIDADITYAVAKYLWATNDRAFITAYGADIAVETARMWTTLGFFSAPAAAAAGAPPAAAAGAAGSGETFHIHAVTGPDEYSAVVDDNFYTNVMAKFNLEFAAAVVSTLESEDPAAHRRLTERLDLQPDEPGTWRRAAAAMTLPFDAERGIHVQDARFLEREPWDFANEPRAKRPLLLHYHPLVIYRHQVLKQADLVLALYLHARLFDLAQKRADFDFYDPLTTGDSTLSAAVQSIIAAEVGHADLAMSYFERMLYVDLADLHANTADGVHVASVGGAYQALVGGFGGMRDDGGELRFDPRLPDGWSGLSFSVRNAGARLRVTLEPHQIAFENRGGPPVAVSVGGQKIAVSGGEPVTVSL